MSGVKTWSPFYSGFRHPHANKSIILLKDHPMSLALIPGCAGLLLHFIVNSFKLFYWVHLVFRSTVFPVPVKCCSS